MRYTHFSKTWHTSILVVDIYLENLMPMGTVTWRTTRHLIELRGKSLLWSCWIGVWSGWKCYVCGQSASDYHHTDPITEKAGLTSTEKEASVQRGAEIVSKMEDCSNSWPSIQDLGSSVSRDPVSLLLLGSMKYSYVSIKKPCSLTQSPFCLTN